VSIISKSRDLKPCLLFPDQLGTGLIAEPVSSERGDVDETLVPNAPQNEVGEPEQPLAIAVVQPEETSDPGNSYDIV
jgi:hypothetical protein